MWLPHHRPHPAASLGALSLFLTAPLLPLRAAAALAPPAPPPCTPESHPACHRDHRAHSEEGRAKISLKHISPLLGQLEQVGGLVVALPKQLHLLLPALLKVDEVPGRTQPEHTPCEDAPLPATGKRHMLCHKIAACLLRAGAHGCPWLGVLQHLPLPILPHKHRQPDQIARLVVETPLCRCHQRSASTSV